MIFQQHIKIFQLNSFLWAASFVGVVAVVVVSIIRVQASEHSDHKAGWDRDDISRFF